MRKNTLLALGAFTLATAAPMAGAQAVPILPSPTLHLAGSALTFGNFTCNVTTSGGGLGGPASCNAGAIDVSTPDSNRLRFNAGFAAAAGRDQDVTITYDVSSTSPIGEIDLSWDGAVLFGMAIGSVTESVYTDLGGLLVGQLVVSCDLSGKCDHADPFLESSDIPLRGIFTFLHIEKDVLLLTGPTGGITTSFIDQSFHIAPPTPITEPHSNLALLGLGFVGLGLARNLRARAKPIQ